MDIVSAENLVLEEGKSSELTQCLQVIQETTVDDVDKYTEKTCRELARIIVCRTYAPVVHELCHLAVAAAHHDGSSGRYEELFWSSGPARAAAFRAYLERQPDAGGPVRVGGGEVTIAYPDQSFSVAYGRMPVLSALLEFLMTALGYTTLDEVLAPLTGDLPDAAAVSDAAKALSRQLYGYLQDHLPTVQAQRKHRSFLAYAAAEAGGGLVSGGLNDDLVLGYWLSQAGDGDGADVDAKTFKGVFETAARLVRILRYAEEKRAMAAALPIGSDFEAGEVDAAEWEQAVGEIEDTDDPFGEWEETLSGVVKFMNKREFGVLAEAVHGDAVAVRLPRSIMRSAVFGQAQARLTQAQRGKTRAPDMNAMIVELPDDDYETRLGAYRDLADHMARMLLAAFHVLSTAGHSHAIALALELRPDLDFAGLSAQEPEWQDGNVVSFQAAQAGRAFFENLHGDTGGQLASLREAAASAFKAVSRKGFSPADIADGGMIEAFAAGARSLSSARRDLAEFTENRAATIDWAALFDADRPQFRDQFLLLYGGRDG